MVIVKLIGGLGNQLFQYAFGYQMAKLNNTDLRLDVGGFQKYKLHKIAINHFDINYEETVMDNKELNNLIYYMGIKRILRQKGIIKPKIQTITDAFNGYNPEVMKVYGHDIHFDGFWQSEKYFKNSEKDLRLKLKIITAPSEQNKKFISLISNANAVSLHVRRADYVNDSSTLSEFGACSIEYYRQAIEKIQTVMDKPVFFVFSDDIEWAKENIKTGFEQYFVDFNNADTNYEDLRLMSLCKHHIIANSSFSWWGAWLNPNPDKTVIAPKNWFANPDWNFEDIVPENWIKM